MRDMLTQRSRSLIQVAGRHFKWTTGHVAPSGAYLYLFLAILAHSIYCAQSNSNNQQITGCLPEAFRIDCHPEKNSNAAECLRRGCCWSTAITNETDIANENSKRANREPKPPFVAQPSCFFPTDFDCFEPIEEEDLEEIEFNILRWKLQRKPSCPPSGLPDDASRLEVTIAIHGDALINIKISEPDRRRFEPSLPEIKLPKTYASKEGTTFYDQLGTRWLVTGPLLATLVKKSNTNVRANKIMIIHGATGKVLFEVDLGKLIYSRQLIQLTTKLGSPYIYGFGLHQEESLLKDSGNEYAKSYTLFNYGHPPQADGRTSYSSYPFYLNLAQLRTGEPIPAKHIYWGEVAERRLLATGALMLNSNAMDVLVHSSEQALTWRLVGGIVDLYLFSGPEPHDVIGQYSTLIGTPALPAAWALGYHQSRYNYRDMMPIKSAWAGTRGAGCPVESIWTDIEFLWRTTSYTLNDPQLAELVEVLQNQFEMHYVAIADPAISVRESSDEYLALRLAKAMGLLAYTMPPPEETSETVESSIAIVNTWTESGSSGLIDFTHPEAVDYLKEVLANYKKQLNFDGLWLDMNEPEVFGNELDEQGNTCTNDAKLPYEPGNRKLSDRTLCMSAQFSAGSHQDLHNLYAFYQSRAHYQAIKALNYSQRPFVISRAQFPGQAKYSGSWLGDLGSSFDHLRWSLLGTIESNWFGQPLVGADICGFFGSASDELCARWFSLGAFYPLARNHNGAMTRDQDPGSMGEQVQRSARIALMRRYSLLPYLYTLFQQSYKKGLPVVRSVLFEFFSHFHLSSNLENLPQINDQFMWGSSLMVAPVLEQDKEHRSVYLPAGRWYDISIGLPGTNMDEGPFNALRSNWPSTTTTLDGEPLSEEIRSRLDSLRKPLDCAAPDGCQLENLYTPVGALNLYLRGGQVVPSLRQFSHTQSVDALWRDAVFFLEVALDAKSTAQGVLFWDDGQSDPSERRNNLVDFWASGNLLLISVVEARAPKPFKLEGLLIYGVEAPATAVDPQQQVSVSINRPGVNTKLNYNLQTKTLSCLFISANNEDEIEPIQLAHFSPLEINWSFEG